MSTEIIRAYYVHPGASGGLTLDALQRRDGIVCDYSGEPLRPTEERRRIEIWPDEGHGRVYHDDENVWIVPEPDGPGAWLSHWCVKHQCRYGWTSFHSLREAESHQSDCGAGACGIEWRLGVSAGEEWSS